MRKLVAIGGMPASGKTTLMKRFLAEVPTVRTEPAKLVVAMHSEVKNLYVLGDFSDPDEKFPGTDRLSMAVQPNAIEFLKSTTANILFEGDRLFTASFLESAVELVEKGELDLKVLIITADKGILDQRHVERQDTQSEKFLKGRETKYENIQSSLVLFPYLEVRKNNTLADRERIFKWLMQELL